MTDSFSLWPGRKPLGTVLSHGQDAKGAHQFGAQQQKLLNKHSQADELLEQTRGSQMDRL